MASLLEGWVLSPFGIVAIALWTVLAIFGIFWFASRLSSATGDASGDVVQRVFRNSMIPIGSQVLVRVVDLIVAIALLRLLGPTGNGQYAVAVVVWLYVKTISDFGLALLTTREVARDRSSINMIVGETTIFRWLVLLLTAVPVAAYVGLSLNAESMATQSALAILLLYLSIVPSSYAEAINSALNGLERMEVAAVINVGISVIRAPLAVLLGASALGVSGVALAAVVTSVLSAFVFQHAVRTIANLRTRWSLSRSRARYYARESWPLLVNSLLVSLFFRVDVFIISAFQGDAALGIYDAAYKLINLMTIIPAYATLAVFPIMTQRANDAVALKRAQRTTTYSLVIVAWVVVFGLTALSDIAVGILAGDEYLPEAALLLRILIWFAPISFINGIFQYVLVATNEQRKIVPAFVAAVVFNFAANLIFVPLYGARAAAVLTIGTEVVILAALLVVSTRTAMRLDLPATLLRTWKPMVAGVLATATALLFRNQPLLAISSSTAVFALIALAIGVVGHDEKELVRRLIAR